MTTTYIIIGIVLMIGIQFVFPTALSSIMTGLTYGFGKAMFEAWAIRRKRIKGERKANPRQPIFRRNVPILRPDGTTATTTTEEPTPQVRRHMRDGKSVPFIRTPIREPLVTTTVEEPGGVTMKVTANAEPLKPDTPTMSNDERQGLVRQWVRHRRGRGRHG